MAIGDEIRGALHTLHLVQKANVLTGDNAFTRMRMMTARFIAAETNLRLKYVLDVMFYHGWDEVEKRAAVADEVMRARESHVDD